VSEPVRKALRILVAEDNVLNQRVAVAALKQLGHTGVVVADGEKALMALDKLAFDLVILDVMMPVMDGMSALAAIRARDQSGKKRMPVLMATSHDLPGDRHRLLAAGADGYLAKPIDIARLQAEIDQIFQA
jgi:CheY-like chemotaxis protein